MQPQYLPVSNIFSNQTRHTVPLFQRPYVWTKEAQWEPLWDDIRGVAEQLLAPAGKPVAAHFLGTVVFEQTPNPTGSHPRREVIDGQQRLTTLQIVLKAAENTILSIRSTVSADESAVRTLDVTSTQLARLTKNSASEFPNEEYKVWPTNEDREAFVDVMDTESSGSPKKTASQMAEAYNFFCSEFSAWLLGGDLIDRTRALSAVLQEKLKLIVLDLEPSDEPQAIFETLNAHGTPLLPADLIKNWFLWEASRAGLQVETLYNQHWRAFDREHAYWRKNVGTGHAARPRIDLFLQNWLTRRTHESVAVKHLYQRFLAHVGHKAGSAKASVNIEETMADIASDAKLYRRIEAPEGKSRFDDFLRRLAALDVVVFHPLLLELMRRSASDNADLDAAGALLESYLVRRMICAEQTRGYGNLMLSLLPMVCAVPVSDAITPHLVSALATAADKTLAWSDDATFRNEWLNRKFYKSMRNERVIMILRALEEAYQSELTSSEPVLAFDYNKLEIEHIMPQSWEEHWPLAESVITRDARNWALHGIGNLTLISGKLNKEQSNGPWLPRAQPPLNPGKRAGLAQHSKLELNAVLLRDFPNWDDAAIKARAEKLFDKAVALWPAPNAAQN